MRVRPRNRGPPTNRVSSRSGGKNLEETRATAGEEMDASFNPSLVQQTSNNGSARLQVSNLRRVGVNTQDAMGFSAPLYYKMHAAVVLCISSQAIWIQGERPRLH